MGGSAEKMPELRDGGLTKRLEGKRRRRRKAGSPWMVDKSAVGETLVLEDKIGDGICNKGKSASGLDQVLLNCVEAPKNT